MVLTLRQLAENIGLNFTGDPDQEIHGVGSLTQAVAGELSFIQHKKYLTALEKSQCSVLIVPIDFDPQMSSRALIFSPNPQLSFVRSIGLINPELLSGSKKSIHPSAQISPGALIGSNVTVGALTVIGDQVVIGDDVVIGDSCVIEKGASIGSGCLLHSRVTVAHNVIIGNNCLLQSGSVLGSDGFGFIMDEQKWVKIPQIGTLVLGNNVEIGANSTIDRGALDDTVIEQGCILDNQIHVAHNVHIGEYTAIAACVGIAGSAVIGRYCRISGGVGVLGHLSIADHVTITAMSLVTKDIKESGVYSSGTPLLGNSQWHKNNVRYKSLDQLAKRVGVLENEIKKKVPD